MVTRVDGFHCNTCLNFLDAFSEIGGNSIPKKNDISVCFYCGTISTFDEELNLSRMSEKEIEDLKINNPEAYEHLYNASLYILKKIKNN